MTYMSREEPAPFVRFMSGSRPIDLDGIEWDAIRDYPLTDDVLRIVAYMQDVESHTVIFPRTFFSRRALEDAHVGPFLICWLYEEGMHGRALSRFLDCAGHPITPRTQGRTTLRDRIDRTVTRMMSAGWKDFLALHMTGEDGRKAAKHVDQSIATLPGFSDATLLGNWLERHVYE